jgi:hypothetical protein
VTARSWRFNSSRPHQLKNSCKGVGIAQVGPKSTTNAPVFSFTYRRSSVVATRVGKAPQAVRVAPVTYAGNGGGTTGVVIVVQIVSYEA